MSSSARIRASQDLVDVICRLAPDFVPIGPVGHEPACRGEASVAAHRGPVVRQCEIDDRLSIRIVGGGGQYEQAVGPVSQSARKRTRHFVIRARRRPDDFDAEAGPCGLKFAHVELGAEHRQPRHTRRSLHQ